MVYVLSIYGRNYKAVVDINYIVPSMYATSLNSIVSLVDDAEGIGIEVANI